VLDPFHLPLFNTIILLLSGTTVTWAHHSLIHGERGMLKFMLLVTVLLGVLFTSVQAYEYAHAPFAFKESIYGATFFMATGFHGFHVIIGTIFLIVCLIRANMDQFSPKHHLGFEFAAWYWHFVDVVWIFLFAAIYIGIGALIGVLVRDPLSGSLLIVLVFSLDVFSGPSMTSSGSFATTPTRDAADLLIAAGVGHDSPSSDWIGAAAVALAGLAVALLAFWLSARSRT